MTSRTLEEAVSKLQGGHRDDLDGVDKMKATGTVQKEGGHEFVVQARTTLLHRNIRPPIREGEALEGQELADEIAAWHVRPGWGSAAAAPEAVLGPDRPDMRQMRCDGFTASAAFDGGPAGWI